MKVMQKRLTKQRGLSGLEYGLLAAIIVVALGAGAILLRDPLTNAFNQVAGAMSG